MLSFVHQTTTSQGISNMVEKLCVTYGHKLGHYKDKDYFTFPPVEALAAEGVEEALR